jgi:dipeptidyl-peptidase-4
MSAKSTDETIDNSLLTLERLFTAEEFKAEIFGPARWLKDDVGNTADVGYTTLEKSEAVEGGKDIVHYEPASNGRTILVSAQQLIPDGQEKPLKIDDYEWSDDGQKLLIFSNGQRVWRLNTRGDYWLLDLTNGRLQQLGGEGEAAAMMFAKFSPDASRVAFVREQNIYVQHLDSGSITQLTTDGGDHIINGTSDWVYEEEFRLRDGFCWSPDGRFIAYWQFDTSGTGTFHLINNTDAVYPKLIPLPYPKAGTTNSAVRVGVVAAAGGATTWFAVPGEPRDHYLPKMEWAASSEQVIIQQLNRLQNTNTVMLGDVADGAVHTILVEQDEAWLDLHNDLQWLDEGAAFTWISERDGWRHLYRVSRDGQTVTLLTPGDYDVISVQKIDAAGGWVYFIASPDNPTQRYLYRVSLDGRGTAERLSPADQPGTHSYQISSAAHWAFHTVSSFDRPPVVSLVSLPEHGCVRPLQPNQPLHDKVNAIHRQPVEFFRVAINDGVLLDGWCIKPPDFDPQQKYPVLFYVYGEPAGQTVKDEWPGVRGLWHQMLAQQGYVVMSVDNRGTPAPRGRGWRKCLCRQIGVMTTADQAAAVKKIVAERPYLDPNRIAVWGWSGGGTMTLNAMFRYPDVYNTGIAVAPVSDFHLYDTVYEERYMGVPSLDAAEDYVQGSPITFAHQLAGNLLIIHGTGDDNVHYQSTERLVNELIKHNKPFSMMAYPNRSHAIKEGDNTQRHLYGLITRYLQQNL